MMELSPGLVVIILVIALVTYWAVTYHARLRAALRLRGAELVAEIARGRQLEAQALKLTRIYTVLSDINQSIIHAHGLPELFGKACQVAVAQGGFGLAWVGLLSPATQKLRVIAHAGRGAELLAQISDLALAAPPQPADPLDDALRSARRRVCDCTDPGSPEAPYRQIAIALGFASMAAFPLIVGDRVRGLFVLYATEADHFDEVELKLLDELAQDLSYAIEFSEQEEQRRWAQAETLQINRLYQVLSQVNQQVLRAGAAEELFQNICQIAVELGGFKLAWVAALDRARQAVQLVAQSGDPGGFLPRAPIPLGGPRGESGPLSAAITTGEPFISVEFAQTIWAEAAKAIGFDAMGAFPIRQGGVVCGVLNIYVDSRDYFRIKEINLLKEVADDISFALDHQQQEAQRRQAELALVESERRYRELFLSNPHPMWVYDLETLAFLEVNDAAIAKYGYSRAEFLAMTIRDIRPPDDVSKLLEYVSQRDWAYSQPNVWRHCLKDGTAIAVEISSHALNHAGRPARLVLAVDITERLAVEERIRALNLELERRVQERTAQLESSNRELESFAYSVSHDLRAPLRAIDGFSRILAQEYAQNLDAEGQRLLGIVRDNTARMDRLIIDLLALSRVSRIRLDFAAIDMAKMAQAIYHELVTPDIAQKFAFRVGPLPAITGDATLMRQVWSNLIGNAIKYTLPKEERVIEICGSVQEDACLYSVRDTGVGFNPKYTHKLFGPFQRLHKESEFEGTGVGLAIVQRIVHRHGGRVWAEGEIGKGATFYFTIPQRQVNDA